MTEATAAATKGPSVLTDPDVLFQSIHQWKSEGYHVLSPATRVSHFAAGWGISVSMVLLDSRVDDNGRGSDTYFDAGTMKQRFGADSGQTERGIAKIGLSRIAQCAGVSWDPIHSGRTDSRTILHFWEFRAVGVAMALDGTVRTLHGTGEVDYRDGSAQIGGWTPELWQQELERVKGTDRKPSINGWSDRRVLSARSHGLARAETKAMERALRMDLGLKHIYTVSELTKPFVVLRAVYMPDMQDPTIRQMVAAQAMSGTRQLFAAQRPSMPAEIIDITSRVPQGLPEPAPVERFDAPPVAEPMPVSTAAMTLDAPTVTAPVAPSVSAPAPPPTAMPPAAAPVADQDGSNWLRGVSVSNVKVVKTGENRRGPWALVRIALSNGQSYTTMDADAAEAARRATGPVDVRLVQDGQYLNVMEVRASGAVAASDMKW